MIFLVFLTLIMLPIKASRHWLHSWLYSINKNISKVKSQFYTMVFDLRLNSLNFFHLIDSASWKCLSHASSKLGPSPFTHTAASSHPFII